jgi:hypothetical protein
MKNAMSFRNNAKTILFGVLSLSIIANLWLLLERGEVSEDQAQRIAYGVALHDCLQQNDSAQCKNLHLVETKWQDLGLQEGLSFWSFHYSTGPAPDGYSTGANITAEGKEVSNDDIMNAIRD